MHRRRDHFHRVIDGETGVDESARAVYVHLDRLIGILGIQVEQLGDDQIGHLIGERHSEKDNALFQKKAVDVVGPLAPARVLNYHRNDIRRHQTTSLKLTVGMARPTRRFGAVMRLRRLRMEPVVERMKHLNLPFGARVDELDGPRFRPVAWRSDVLTARSKAKTMRCARRDM